MEQLLLIGLSDATFGNWSHHRIHPLILLLHFQVQVHPLLQLYILQSTYISRRFWRRSKKEEPLLGGEGNQRKATYGACDHSDGVVDVEAEGVRGL